MTPISTKSGAIPLVQPNDAENRIYKAEAYNDIFPYLENLLAQTYPSENIQLQIADDGTAFKTGNPSHLPLVQEVFKKHITETLKVKQITQLSPVNHRVITLEKGENKLFLHYVKLGEFNSFDHAIQNLAKRYPKVGATNEKGISALKKHLRLCVEYAGKSTEARETGEKLFEYLIKEVDLHKAEKFAKDYNLEALKTKVAAEKELQSNISQGTNLPTKVLALVSSYLPQT